MPIDVSEPAFVEFHEKLLSSHTIELRQIILREVLRNGSSISLQNLAEIAHREFHKMHSLSEEAGTIHSFATDVQHILGSIQHSCVELFKVGENPHGFVLADYPGTPVRRKDDDLSTHTVEWRKRPKRMAAVAGGEQRKSDPMAIEE